MPFLSWLVRRPLGSERARRKAYVAEDLRSVPSGWLKAVALKSPMARFFWSR